jgi:cytochrome P450
VENNTAGTAQAIGRAPRFDAFGLGLAGDPYPGYAQLREAGPLCRGGPGQWLVPRYEEVHALLRDQRLAQFQFGDAYRLFPRMALRDTLGDGPARTFTQHIVAGTDRPAHTALRGLLARAFTPRQVAALAGQVTSLIEELAGPAVRDGGLDAVTGLAFPLPLLVLAELVGLPRTGHGELGRRLLALTRIFSPVIAADDRHAADDAVTWLRDYVGALFADRRADPRDDVLSALAVAHRAHQIGPEETVDNALFLLFAGFETSLNMIASGCALLAAHPAEWARLRADPELARTAVEEFLRFDAPTQLTGRIVAQPLTVAGRPLRPGRVVLLLLGSANRDDRQFPDPDRLDIGRDRNPHLSFGGGIHFCLGAALARMEGAAVFGWLARRCESLEPAGPPEREHGAALRAYTRVPLRVRGRTGTS